MKFLSIFRLFFVIIIFACLLPASTPVAAQGETWVIDVNDTRDLPDYELDNVCDAEFLVDGAQCTLRAAIDEANHHTVDEGVLIILPAGTYTLSIPGTKENENQTGDLDLRPQNMNIIIEGADALTTIIDANGIDRVFDVGFSPQTSSRYPVELRNLTITGGSLTGMLDGTLSLAGGGIYNAGNLTLSNVIIQGNRTDYIEGGTGGTGADGGGIFSGNSDGLVINASIIRGNSAVRGGGIFSNSYLRILNSTISGNHAYSHTTVTPTAGAIDNYHVAYIYNSTISGNDSTYTVGGINHNGLYMYLANVTLVNNQSLYNPANLSSSGMSTVEFRNSIIAYPQSEGNAYNCDLLGMVFSHGYNVSDDDSCDFFAGGDLMNIDPRLSPLARLGNTISPYAPTHGLLPGSPAKDHRTGVCMDFEGFAITTDQRGVNRSDGKCDTGAFEGSAWTVFLPATLR